ncbi:MAG: hypothetical protein J5716_06905 [Alphaproteobacteria bacterium]|nr:hypothetical protein [Alphaproteobacteria bacterium]
MALKDRFFKLKLKIVDFKLKAKNAFVASFRYAKALDTEKFKAFLPELEPLLRFTPLNLKEWTVKTSNGVLRFVLLFVLLSLIFYIAGSRYAFTANDAFISFRYVANAVNGLGYTFNPPPFEPVSGYTSFLWLSLLRILWAIGLTPPFSAHLLTFVFSMGQIWLIFLFVRRMDIQSKMQAKSLYLFLAICLILLTNRTFLAFMTSGTETALFNFLVLWWTFAAANNKSPEPLSISVSAVLLALCRAEGIIFIPASALFLIWFINKKEYKLNCMIGFVLLALTNKFYFWINDTYGNPVPHSFLAFYRKPFPDFGIDYILSFILEYALYFWAVIFVIWAVFKFAVLKCSDFMEPLLLTLTFAAYIFFYLFLMGGDILEYRPLSFFIPLCAVAGVKMLAENVVAKVSSVLTLLLVYELVSTAIPMTHRDLTKKLETRQETAFLYRPVSGHAGLFGFFTTKWDNAQKNLISQGICLRHQEHKVLTEELLKTFPSREKGAQIPRKDNRLFAGNFVGVPGWTLPEVIMIDLSGQNNKIIAKTDFKYPDRRLFGHDRKIPDGYVQCFGGQSIRAEKQNAVLLGKAFLSDGMIKGCEDFWKAQYEKKAPKLKKPFPKL